MPEIITIKDEAKRGCGFRKSGGIYLMGDFPASGCGKLPAPLCACPVCGQGIKQARGVTKINPRKLFSEIACDSTGCGNCPMGDLAPTAGWLLWVGENFYKSPKDFMAEAQLQGISRRVSAVPRNFIVGRDLVYLAHAKSFWSEKPEDPNQPMLTEDAPKAWAWLPGVFSAFRPTRIEYILKGEETKEELQKLADRGLTLVKLVRTKKADKTAKVASVKDQFSEQAQESLFDQPGGNNE